MIRKTIAPLTGLLVLAISISAQSSTTLTTSSANVNGFRSVIDHPDLNGNPDAILKVSAPGYNHPIAVWYLANKWYVFNTDQASMAQGQVFRILYWSKPDAAHFTHVATAQNVRRSRSCIDHQDLNGRSGAVASVFQSMSNVRGGYWNANEATLEYDQSENKWCVLNKNGQPILAGNAYNVIIEVGLPIAGGSPPSGGITDPNPNTGYIPPARQGTPVAGGPLSPAYAAEPLRFGPTLGRKIIFYPGQTGDVGVTVQGNVLQIHSDNPSADVAIGYDQNGTFKERLRVKANGALEVNGNAGKPGEFLVSKGPGEPPVWTPMSAPVYSFANCEPDTPNAFLGIKCTAQAGPNQSATMEGLRAYLTLKRTSVVVMNARFRQSSEGGAIFITANGARVSPLMRYSGPGVHNFTITDLMFRLEPGTYTLDCRFLNLGTGNGGSAGEYVSYTAYPIE